MAEDEVRDLVSSVAQRGAALGVSTLPEEIRHNFSRGRHPDGHRIPTASVLRRRISVVVVAALILAVFFLPLPHVSLFRHLVTPAGPSTTASVPSTVPNTSSTGPRTNGPRLAGVDGAAAWALSATRLSVSDDGGLDWSDLALPGGVSPGAVASIAEASNGELWLATVKGASTVKLYRRETSTSAGWSYTTLVPAWPTAADGFRFRSRSVMITPGPSGMVTVVVLAGTGHTGAVPRLFVSLDEGATFRQYPMPVTSTLNTHWQSVTFSTRKAGVVIVSPGAPAAEALFHTSDGGSSWSPVSITGLPTGAAVVFGTPFSEGTDIELPVVASTSKDGETFALYVSHDGGASFAGPIGSVISADSFGPGPSPLAAYGQTLWVVGEARTYESGNDGRSWRTVRSSGLPPITAMSLTSPTAATAVAGISSCARVETGCASRTYFVRTTDAGKTWNALSDVPRTTRTVPASGQSLRQVWPVGASTVWAWTQDLSGTRAQGLEQSTDGGKNWNDVTPPGMDEQVGDHIISGFFALDADHAWVTYGGIASSAAQTIASTSDGGRHWTVVSRLPSTYGCELQFVTPWDGWCAVIGGAAGSEGVDLYGTEDGGKHWSLVSESGPTGTTNTPGALPFGCDKNVQFASPSVGWAYFHCNGGLAPLYESTDGGRTWVSRGVAAPSVAPAGGSGFSGSPVLAGANGAVGFTSGGSAPKTTSTVVYVSTDAGVSWHPVTPPGRPQEWLVDTMTPLSWRLVNGDHILATDDGGRTWRTITSNVSFALSSPVVDFVTNQVGWIEGWSSVSGGSLRRTTDGGSNWRNVVVPGT